MDIKRSDEILIKDIDTLKLANTILSNDDKTNMIAKLVIETADLNREIEKRDKRINKAIEYMNNYNELVIPDANIKSLVLKEEYKKIISMLQGEDK